MMGNKIFKSLLALSFMICIMLALSSCAALDSILGASPNNGACEHNMVETAAKDPTCKEVGNVRYFTCSKCNKIYADAAGAREIAAESTVVAVFDHTESDWIVDTEPTCTEAGARHKECIVCGEATLTTAIFAKGHSFVDVDAKDAGCYEDGYNAHKACSVCGRTKDKEIIPAGHVGEWIAVDTSYEQLLCEVCGRIQKRERNAEITFDNGAILDDGGKLSVRVGKLTGTGDPSVGAAAGLTEFGNARDKFTLVSDAEEKMIKVVSKVNSNYASSSIILSHTDPLHKANANDDGGKYLVFDFDAKFNFNTGSATTDEIFTIWVGDSNSNYLANIPIQSFNRQIKANFGSTIDNYSADGKTWITFRTVVELATDKDASENYTAYIKLYYKLRGAEGPMTLLVFTTRSSTNTYAFVERTDSFVGKIVLPNTQSYNYTYYLDNLSFIRTNDANYFYSSCDHAMSDWTTESESVECETDGVVKRNCTKDGCGYTETEYLSAHKLTTVQGKPATCTEAGYTAHSVCSKCGEVIGKLDISKKAHELTDWAVVNDKQQKNCINGCGYYESRDNHSYLPVTFDTGSVTDGWLLYSIKPISTNSATLTSPDGYVTYRCDYSPTKWGDFALCVKTVISKYIAGNALRVQVPLRGSAGNIYTVDFDICDETATTYNGTSTLLQMRFCGETISLYTYGDSIQFGSGLKGLYQIGKVGSWIGVRMVFNIIEDGKASYDVLVKLADGSYKHVCTRTLSGTGIRLDRELVFAFDSYSSQIDRTYYLDNILFTRHEVGYSAAE